MKTATKVGYYGYTLRDGSHEQGTACAEADDECHAWGHAEHKWGDNNNPESGTSIT
jgi:hypothetical protein